MSGERVNAMKERAGVFLELASELADRGRLDIASFSVQQACQLRVKASLLRLTGEMPRIHSIRELLGILAKRMEEIGHRDEAEKITGFVRESRGVLVDIEAAYTESRYGLAVATESVVREMLRVADCLFRLLEEVENSVLG